MSHFLANLITLPLPRTLRRKVRRALVQFRIRDWFAFRRFERGTVRENAVLLIEANDCHGEVIGGYLEYFRELGYSVDVLVNCRILEENPFCRLDIADIGVWSCYFGAFKWFFGGRRILQYRHVLLMSSAGYRFIDGGDATSIMQSYPALSRVKSLFVVEHELRDVDRFGERAFLETGRVFTLGRFSVGVFACPLRLGAMRTHSRGRVVTFVTVGTFDAARKNHEALTAAVAQLDAEGLDFRVVVVGKGDATALPPAVRRHVECLGRLDYSQMFDCVEQADFFLPLLDSTNPDHNRYITSGVTGSAQLIYAFHKVPVIDSHFAPFYGFDDGNAVVANDLAGGMRRAIALSGSDYAALRDRLAVLSEELKAISLANLGRALNG